MFHDWWMLELLVGKLPYTCEIVKLRYQRLRAYERTLYGSNQYIQRVQVKEITTLSVPLNQKGRYSLLVCLIMLVGAIMLERLVRWVTLRMLYGIISSICVIGLYLIYLLWNGICGCPNVNVMCMWCVCT